MLIDIVNAHKREQSLLWKVALATAILALCSALGLNALFALTGIVDSSAAYQEVAKRQYSVAFGAGLLRYGLLFPLAEEVLFRGLLFRGLRRFLPAALSILGSALLFGFYHGNSVQGLYAFLMGTLMAWVYERGGSFALPCLFHAVANSAVFSLTASALSQELRFSWPVCALLLGAAAGCGALLERLCRGVEKSE